MYHIKLYHIIFHVILHIFICVYIPYMDGYSMVYMIHYYATNGVYQWLINGIFYH